MIPTHLLQIAQEKSCNYLYKILASHFVFRNTTFHFVSILGSNQFLSVTTFVKPQLRSPKYTPSQLGVTGSLLPKTVRDATPNREVNGRKRKTSYRFALNSNNIDRCWSQRECLIIWQLFAYTCRAWREFPLRNLIVINKSITHENFVIKAPSSDTHHLKDFLPGIFLLKTEFENKMLLISE